MTLEQFVDKQMRNALRSLDSAHRELNTTQREIDLIKEEVAFYDEIRRLISENNRTER